MKEFTKLGCLLILFFIFNKVIYSQGGPAQPEFTGFKPIADQDNVSLFSGDLNYSIPLLDIDGFPIALNYLGSVSNTEEGSWVGLGWNLNIGTINRQLRGIPDEFNGKDIFRKSYNIKPNITAGVNLGTNFQVVNFQPLKRKLGLGLSLGITYNNYTGWSHELAISPSVSMMGPQDGPQNKANEKPKGGDDADAGSGMSVEKKASLQCMIEEKNNLDTKITPGIGNNATTNKESVKFKGFTGTYNKNILDNIKSKVMSFGSFNSIFSTAKSFLSFASPTYNPKVIMPMSNNMFALSVNLHGDAFFLDGGLTVMGHLSVNSSANYVEKPMYGYFNLEKGANDQYAMMDFNRDKDMPFHKNVPAIAVPNLTYDLFVVNQTEFSSQYRAYRTSPGILFDSKTANSTTNVNIGITEFGIGNMFEAGGTLNLTLGETETKKWNIDNKHDFVSTFIKEDIVTSLLDNYYIKSNGETNTIDNDFFKKINYGEAMNVPLIGSGMNINTSKYLADKKGKLNVIETSNSFGGGYMSYPKNKIDIGEKDNNKTNVFSYLDVSERRFWGLEKTIKSYKSIKGGSLEYQEYQRTDIPEHHISEITITNKDGKRSVYGIPVYNNFQKEVSFNVGNNQPDANGLVSYTQEDASPENKKGVDRYYNSETVPAYPHSWLLTAILSEDYQDVTGDGISDDDIGTAVKFNYSLMNKDYKWRNPVVGEPNKGNYNPGQGADLTDSKCSYVYGTREEWYLHSIETKNMIAIFYTSTREDALGSSEHNGIDKTSLKYKLDSIALFSKSDFFQNGIEKATAIKKVIFNTSYELCKGVPNSNNQKKLTLNAVAFKYLDNNKIQNKYSFQYDYNPLFSFKNTDRWGTYKPFTENPNNLENYEFPYSIQDKQKADLYASAWLLSGVKMPSGAEMKFTFESDDYKYVQNYRTAFMSQILGFGRDENGYNEELYINYNRNFLYFKFKDKSIPKNTDELKRMYLYDNNNLDFKDKIFYKVDVNVFENKYESILGYADIKSYGIYSKDPTIGWIQLGETEGEQPVAFSGWQYTKSSFPKKAYPWNDLGDNMGPLGFIMALPSYLGNIAEMFVGYASIAKVANLSRNMRTKNSFVRLLNPDAYKLGGGYRVSSVKVKDNWGDIAGTGYKTGEYGKIYKYTVNEGGAEISSGVAEYEPLFGGDENPFRKPISYNDPGGFLSPSSPHYIEEPLCESHFPSPNVGYSKVTVLSKNSPLNNSVGRGYSVSEFYTAKDFPIRTDRTYLDENTVKVFEPNLICKFLKIDSRNSLSLSQGFLIETNDMHGKSKSEKTYNQQGSLISEKINYYLTENTSGVPKVKSEIDVVDENGNIIKNQTVGVTFDIYHDSRYQNTKIFQTDIEIGGGAMLAGIFPIPFGASFPPFGIIENKFQSIATMKYINRKGILYKTYTMQDGAKVEHEEVLWDKNTGDPVLSKVNNEYAEPVFSLKNPAYWGYKFMDFASKNDGVVLDKVKIVNGKIDPDKELVFMPGDEVGCLGFDFKNTGIPHQGISNDKMWVVLNPATNEKVFVYRDGSLPINFIGRVRILRSGRRNMLSNTMQDFTTLNLPIMNNRLFVSKDSRILNSSAVEYNDNWKAIKNTIAEKLKGCYNPTLERSILESETKRSYPYDRINCWLGGDCTPR